MPRRFSIIIVHRNGVAMLLRAQAGGEAVHDRIVAANTASGTGSPWQVAAPIPEIPLIRNLPS